MRYSFRLAQLLGHDPDPNKRPGTIKTIVEHTGLDRHQVANLLRNEVKYLPIHALSRICDYLIEKGHCRADELPGKLFAIEPEHFWELLARRARLDICLGVRVHGERDVLDGALVVASDSVLMGEVLNGVSQMHESETPTPSAETPSVLSNMPMQPSLLRQALVWSPNQVEREIMINRANSVYEDFGGAVGDKAMLGIGSVKSNPVVELMISHAFHCKPFVPQDDIKRAVDRSCPFFFRYRSKDPDAKSNSGGQFLAEDTPADKPGIYYENADGSWAHAPSDKSKDAALVFYIHRESQGCLEMALCGFSGRATRTLAKTLASRAEAFWPPIFQGHGVQIGAFILEYTFDKRGGDPSDDFLKTDWVAKNTKVTAIDPEVIERRMV